MADIIIGWYQALTEDGSLQLLPVVRGEVVAVKDEIVKGEIDG